MSWHFVPLLAIAVVATFVLHEGAHWAMGEALSYDMFLRANSAGLARGLYHNEIDAVMVAAAGPAFTLLQGLIAYALIALWRSQAAFPFLLSAFLTRVFAAIVSIGNPNDEVRVSRWLELGDWAVFAGVIGLLAVLVALAARRLGIGWRAFGFGVVCWIVFASALILSEPYLPTYNPYEA